MTRTPRKYIILVSLFGTLGIVFLFLRAPITSEVTRVESPRTESAVEYFGGTHTLGQTFFSPEDGLAEIFFRLRPPVSGDDFPMVFSLRQGRDAATELQTVALETSDVDDDGLVRVPLGSSLRHRRGLYAFVLSAPRARGKGFAAFREIDGSKYPQGTLSRNGSDRPGDLEFSLRVRTPRAVYFWTRFARPFIVQTLNDARVRRALAVGVIAAAVSLLAGASRLRAYTASNRWTIFLLGLLVVANILLHLPFAYAYPGVNDEGAYLMDIQNLKAGRWPFRDTLSKGPLFLALFAPIALTFPHSLIPARLFIASASTVEVVLLFLLARRLGGRGAGLLAATLWALSPVTSAQTTHVFLQPFALPFVTLAFILLLKDPKTLGVAGAGSSWRVPGCAPQDRAELPVTRRPAALHPTWYWGAGALFAAAYLVRASSLAFFAVALITPLTRPPLRVGLRAILNLAVGFFLPLAVFAALSLPLLGPERTAVMFNVEAYAIGRARAETGNTSMLNVLPPREILERLVAWGAALFRVGLPLVLLWLAFLSAHLRALFRLPNALAVVFFLGTSLPLLQRIHAEQYFLESTFTALAPFTTLLTALQVVLLVLFLFRNRSRESSPPRSLILRNLLFVGGTWLALALLYTQFGRFRQQYHAEFLPLYVLGSAIFVAPLLFPKDAPTLVSERCSKALLVGSLVTALFLSHRTALAHPHTGSIPLKAAEEVADILRAHSAPNEEILTAQGLFTYYADRHLPFGASHPGWYLEERAGTVSPELRRLFLPDKAELRRYVREKPIRLVAIDRRTREVYFQHDQDMQAILVEHFRLLTTVQNDLEAKPTEIWIRK